MTLGRILTGTILVIGVGLALSGCVAEPVGTGPRITATTGLASSASSPPGETYPDRDEDDDTADQL